MNPKVDFYFSKAEKWQKEIQRLRKLILDCQLSEELKWGAPTYMYKKSNVVLIHTFKEYCAILFFKGVLLNDTNKILIQQTKNVQAARQIRFTSVQEIIKQASVIKKYIFEACKLEESGAKVKLKKTEDFNLPEEFKNKLKANPSLKTSFAALTPGRQRAYIFYFSQAKQSKTRTSRIEKYIPFILSGKGLDAE